MLGDLRQAAPASRLFPVGESIVLRKDLMANGNASTRRSGRQWPIRVVLLTFALGAGGVIASSYDPSDPMGSLTSAVEDSFTAVSSMFERFVGNGKEAGPRGPQAAPVRIALANVRDVPVVVRTIGTVLANSVVNVKSQVDGPLLAANFKEGQMVRKGDLLFQIDPAPFEATVRQSEAQMARDQAQLASAQADAERAVMLADRGIVSAQQRDQLVANAKALAATVEADRAALDRARLNLGYTKIHSPIDGKTGAYIVYPGNQVRANDQAGLITITEIQPVKIAFNLPQANLPRLQDRMRENALVASVTMRNDVVVATIPGEEEPETGIPVKVDFIGNTVDARTGTIELRATFANPDLRFVPGELIDVAVRLETIENGVFVPHEAVNVGQAGPFVFVIGDDNKADMRPVDVVYEDSFIAVLGSGVKADERVVIDGQLRLTPGTPVSIVGSPAERPSAENQADPNVESSTSRQAAPPPATAQRGGENPDARGG
jgi:multidrug efflux system membrane fusion protein